MKEDNREKALKENLKKIFNKPNVLSTRADQTKITGGEDTGIPCITIYVKKKLKEFYGSGRRRLAEVRTIPKEIEGIPTDVIELSSPDFKVGRTDIGDQPPHIQRCMMGLRKE